MSERVVKLFDGDPRAEELYGALLAVIHERGIGQTISQLLGIIELLKYEIIYSQQ